MNTNEIHNKSQNETVGQFFAWMAKKAKNENTPVSGEVDGVVYEITPEPESIGQAFDRYLASLGIT